MKSRNVFILSLFILGFITLFFCKSETPTPKQQTPDEIMAKIVFSGDLERELLAADVKVLEQKSNLTDSIIRLRDELIKYFNPEDGDPDYQEIGNLLAARGAMIEDFNARYAWLTGRDKIAGLFQGLPRGMLEIEVRHVFIDKIFEEKFVEDNEEGKVKVDMVARIFFKYSVLREEEGELKNQSGGGSFGCLHRHNCPWCLPPIDY
jgi:hypothetical protein